MRVERTKTLPCGCTAEYTGIFQGYEVIGGHTCDGQELARERQEQRADRQQMRAESTKRSVARMREPLPFTILKNTNKARW